MHYWIHCDPQLVPAISMLFSMEILPQGKYSPWVVDFRLYIWILLSHIEHNKEMSDVPKLLSKVL